MELTLDGIKLFCGVSSPEDAFETDISRPVWIGNVKYGRPTVPLPGHSGNFVLTEQLVGEVVCLEAGAANEPLGPTSSLTDLVQCLSGQVEADESYFGGKRPGVMGRGVDKAPVFGMLERKGRVVAVTVPNVKRATVMPHITKRILPRSTVYTDEYKTYNVLTRSGPATTIGAFTTPSASM